MTNLVIVCLMGVIMPTPDELADTFSDLGGEWINPITGEEKWFGGDRNLRKSRLKVESRREPGVKKFQPLQVETGLNLKPKISTSYYPLHQNEDRDKLLKEAIRLWEQNGKPPVMTNKFGLVRDPRKPVFCLAEVQDYLNCLKAMEQDSSNSNQKDFGYL